MGLTVNFVKATLTHPATTCLLVSTYTAFDMDIFTVEPDLKATHSEMSEEDPMSFVESQEDPSSGMPVELKVFIYVLLYDRKSRLEKRKSRLEKIEHVRHLTVAWFSNTATDDPNRTHREKKLKMLSILEVLKSEEREGLKQLLKDRGNLDRLIPRFEEIVTDPGHPEYSAAWRCLPVCYMNLYQHTADIRDLDRSIATAPKLVDALSEEDPAATAVAFWLLSCSLAELHEQRFRVELVADMPVTLVVDRKKLHRARHNFRLRTQFHRRFIVEKTTEDILRAIDCFEEGLKLVAPLYVLADSQQRLWVTTQAKVDFNRAIIDLYERIIRQNPEVIRDAELLQRLSLLYNERCEDGGLPGDIDRSVELMEMAVNLALDEPMSDKDSCRRELANILLQRYDITKSSEDRDSVINTYRSEVRKQPDHEDYDGWLHHLGYLLYDRYEQSKNLKDLEDGIAFTRKCVEKLDENSFGTNRIQRFRETTDLARMLRGRFFHQNEIKDLNESIRALENVISAELHWPEGNVNFCNLAVRLREDLDRAIEINEKAVESWSIEDIKWLANSLNNLAKFRLDRYEQLGGCEDLERALQEAELAVGLMPVEKMAAEGIMCSLPSILKSKYEVDGFEEDIERAIALSIESGKAFSAEVPLGVAFSNNLVGALIDRFNLKGFTDDLDHAVAVAREAASTVWPTDRDRVAALSGLGFVLSKRSKLPSPRASEDLDAAIEVAEQALKLTRNDSTRIPCASCLADYLRARLTIRNDENDRHRVTQIVKDTLSVTPDSHPFRDYLLTCLSFVYRKWYDATKDKKYLNDAVESGHLALSCTPVNAPRWTMICHQTAEHRYLRDIDLGNEEDLDESFKLLSSGWNNVHGTPTFRSLCANLAAWVLAKKSNWEGSYSMYEKAIEFLPIVSPRSLKNQDKQLALGYIGNSACNAVSISMRVGKSPLEALQMLELGRGIIAGSLLEMRTDISELRQKHPPLADRFLLLRDHLDQSSIAVDNAFPSAGKFEWISDADRRGDLGRKFDAILDEIRALEGFDSFLLPPKEADIMGAATKGPIVVVSISIMSCGAFLIEKNRIRALRLLVEEDEIRRMVIKSRNDGITHDILESLWHLVTQPILDALGFVNTPHNDIWPHVWWVPTGSLSHLPLHAAGKHYRGSSETVLDRVISSYTSSIKALIYARRITETSQKIGRNVDFDNHLGVTGNTVVIAMKETPGLGGE